VFRTLHAPVSRAQAEWPAMPHTGQAGHDHGRPVQRLAL